MLKLCSITLLSALWLGLSYPSSADAQALSTTPTTSDVAKTDADRAPTTLSSAMQRHELTIQSFRLDHRIEEAEARYSSQRIAGPITLVAAGYTIGTFFALLTVASLATLDDIDERMDDGSYDELADLNDDMRIDSKDRVEARNMTIGFSCVAIVHMGLGALGNWWLVKRLHNRGQLKRELRALRTERKILDLKLDLAVSDRGATGQLALSF